MSKKNDLVGQTFGRLTVEMDGGRDKKKNIRWFCRCSCGGTVVASASDLKNSKTSSCGCLRREVTGSLAKSHGLSKTRTYRLWSNMLTRCGNSARTHWGRYGGRGVQVDPRWLDFEAFFADMGEAPPKHSLDRKDNDGPYNASNCRWATMAQQSRNTSRNVRYTIFGETLVQTDVVNKYDVRPGTLRRWRNEGMSDTQIEERLTWRQHRRGASKRPW